MPLWVKTQPIQQPDQKIENLNGHEAINLISASSNKIVFKTFLVGTRTIQINTIYFPGWQASVNGVKAKITYNNLQGVMRLNLKKGENNVEVKFSETPLRLASDLLSIASLIGFVTIYALTKYKKIKIWQF